MTERWNVDNGEIPYIPDWNRWDGSFSELQEIIKEEIKNQVEVGKDEEGNITVTLPNEDGSTSTEVIWTKDELKGDKGEDGKDGTNGKQGASWRVSVNPLEDNLPDIKTTDLNPPATVIPYQVGDIVVDAQSHKIYSITEVDPDSGLATIGTSFGSIL